MTAAAGQHLNVGHYRVSRTGDDAFDVLDNEGARAHYRVIQRDERHRLILARFYRKTRMVGDVSGAAITLLTFVPEVAADGQPQVTQRIESTVRIDHRIVALVATVLIPLFPEYADRKIGEVFAIAARVSGWAREKPEEFCAWAGAQPDGPRMRDAFAALLPACANAR